MKRVLLILAVVSLSLAFPACKGKVKDTDVKAAIETAITANPDLAGLYVDVKDGIATITGEAKNDAAKASIETIAAGIKGVKSVVNNASVYVPPVVAPVTATEADALSQAVNDAIKDFPSVKATVTDQVVKLTGEISKANLQKLMMGLNALKAVGLKSIDSKELIKK